MRLEAWHMVIVLVMLGLAAVVLVPVTLLVLGVVRFARKRKSNGGHGVSPS